MVSMGYTGNSHNQEIGINATHANQNIGYQQQ